MAETSSTVDSAAPAELGVHFDTVREKIPEWLYKASAAMRQTFREHLLALETSRYEMQQILGRLRSIEQFCRPRLLAALEKHLNPGLDVDHAQFIRVDSTYLLSIFESKLYTFVQRQTLLEAALQNFEADETEPGALEDRSVIRFPGPIPGRRLILAPEIFARLCRDLDLGGLYQAHIDSVFKPAEPPTASGLSPVERCFHDYDRRALMISADIACMKGAISVAVHDLLTRLANGDTELKLDGEKVRCSRMKLFDIESSGWLVIGAKLSGDAFAPCIAYIPGDPEAPVRHYKSFLSLEHDLALKLHDQGYRDFFSRFIHPEHRLRFLRTIDTRITFRRFASPMGAPVRYVELREIPVEGDVFKSFHQLRYQQIKVHARQLVVPTADVDARVRQARQDAYIEAGLNVLTLALSFVPLIGEVILAATVVKLVGDVYNGLQAWHLGHRREALDYLMDVAENVAMFAAGTLAIRGGRALFKSISVAPSVDSLVPVEVEGRRQLWSTDLTPYVRGTRLPEEVTPDDSGFHVFESRHYLRLEGKFYRVAYDHRQRCWRIEHPGGAAFHAPALKHNGIGTWQTLHAQPAEWTAMQLFQSLGRPVAGLGGRILQHVRQLYGSQTDALRRSLVDNQRPPALLLDTLKRFRIDQSIEQFIDNASATRARTLEWGDLRLRLLTSLPGWPRNRVIHLFNAQGDILQEYGVRTSEQFSSLQISEAQLKSGDVLNLSWSMLSESERLDLLGAEMPERAERSRVLAQRLRQAAEQRRQWLFDSLYEASEITDDAVEKRLLESFPGLPTSVAKELIAHANGAELEQLKERVPLRLAEEARWYLKQLRLNRVCESWYLSANEDVQADRLALHALELLPGWPKSVRIELRRQRILSNAVEAVGPMQASTFRVLFKMGHQYTVLDREGTILGTAQDIFDALALALPQPLRESLAPGASVDGDWFRDEAVRRITRDPEVGQRVLGLAPFNHRFRPPMRLATGRIGYPLSDGGAVLGYSARLTQRVRGLYPGFSDEEVHTFIASLDLSEPACLVELERRREEYETLFATLDSWVQRRTWRRVRGSLQVAPVVMDNKQRVAEAILACWRRQSPRNRLGAQYFHELDLLGMRIGDLPPITADFSHVGFLFMNDMGVSSTELSFLAHFRQLRWLSMGFNHLDSLPSALAQMSELVHLHVPGNRVVMNTQARSLLAGLTRLRFLNLSDNPLVLPPDVSDMPALEHLLLRHTGIDQWPTGLSQARRLQLLDLRDNRIATIPESIYANPTSINRAIHLHDNPPLSTADMQRLERYEQQTGINFGIDTPARRRTHVFRRTPSLKEYDRWSEGLAQGQVAQKEQQWRALFRERGGEDFFRLLADLSATAEYREARQALSTRVWQVLDAASQYTDLREELFVAASQPQTCSDGAELIFSDMEVRTLVFQARVMAADSPALIESNLLKLARGLWRLDQVEALAQADIEARLKGAAAHVDPLEVRLAYRIGLASRLGLPGQPTHMTFTELAKVTQEALDAAYLKVLDRETTPNYVRALVAREFWSDHLRYRYPERLEAIGNRHQAAVQALDARRTSRRDPAWHEFIDVELEAQMGDELRAWRDEQREELEKLTREILQRTPETQL
ncbi:NEL-type E3 ubiquitin ligase domain-containing protein [Pseudomonas asplenii]|uniref:NEL-type E3 ubiquitin ligase domain-containing protein n=1 Tax=Pseudomonas asplenii TaxID=53407 RepID=UPI0003783F47|nr:NEL-type E3 ubiquitin ligase domain-containing protein [Pseudomonas fuscovaginae]